MFVLCCAFVVEEANSASERRVLDFPVFGSFGSEDAVIQPVRQNHSDDFHQFSLIFDLSIHNLIHNISEDI